MKELAEVEDGMIVHLTWDEWKGLRNVSEAFNNREEQ